MEVVSPRSLDEALRIKAERPDAVAVGLDLESEKLPKRISSSRKPKHGTGD